MTRTRNGAIDANESELCDGIANGDDIAECTFTLGNPPFDPGKATNYINAVDGRDKKAGFLDQDDKATQAHSKYPN